MCVCPAAGVAVVCNNFDAARSKGPPDIKDIAHNRGMLVLLAPFGEKNELSGFSA